MPNREVRAYPENMSKEIDRIRARSALETLRESPVIALLPVLVVLGVVWWLTNWFVALVLLIVLGVVVVVRGRLLH
jgi:fatty acid desaturase